MSTKRKQLGERLEIHRETGNDIVRLITIASSPAALKEVLAQMCRETSQIAGAPVVSAYVVEPIDDHDHLVMRGNHGFAAGSAAGVSIPMGEGITGFVAECMAPVTVDAVTDDERHHPVPGLGEESYPVFLGVPIISSGNVLGVLVFQRRAGASFSAAEVVLATALTAPFASAIERNQQQPSSTSLRHNVRLRGRTIRLGSALGRACAIPTLSSLASSHEPDQGAIIAAFDHLARVMGRLSRTLSLPSLQSAVIVFDDMRFRTFLSKQLAKHRGLEGLTRVARTYAKHDDRGSAGLARDIEELCVLAYEKARGGQYIRKGCIVVSQRAGWPIAAACASNQAGALLVEDTVTSAGREVLVHSELPSISNMTNLRTWARHEDLILVDAEKAHVLINPSASAIAGYRRQGKSESAAVRHSSPNIEEP